MSDLPESDPMSEEDEQVDDQMEMSLPQRPRHFSDMLRLFQPLAVEVRGENAWSAAVRFFDLIQSEVKDPEWQSSLVKAWISSVKQRNYSRFAKEFRRWKRSLDE